MLELNNSYNDIILFSRVCGVLLFPCVRSQLCVAKPSRYVPQVLYPNKCTSMLYIFCVFWKCVYTIYKHTHIYIYTDNLKLCAFSVHKQEKGSPTYTQIYLYLTAPNIRTCFSKFSIWALRHALQYQYHINRTQHVYASRVLSCIYILNVSYDIDPEYNNIG